MATFCVHGIALSDECNACIPGWKRPPEPVHNVNNWTEDRRPIRSAYLLDDNEPGVYTAQSGCDFTRFERPGDMASIPWLRVRWNDIEIEAPLARWCVAFDKDPVL
jgi:hypothetical protein